MSEQTPFGDPYLRIERETRRASGFPEDVMKMSLDMLTKKWAAKTFRVPVHNIGAVMFAAGPGRANPRVLIGFIHDDEMEDATYELEDTSVAEFIRQVLSA